MKPPKTRKITLSSTTSVQIEVTKDGYKYKGFYVERITFYHNYWNKIAQKYIDVSCKRWGYSKVKDSILCGACYSEDTLKEAISEITEHY